MKGLIGKKLGMTQVFDEGGAVHPVTLIEAGPCFVTQIRRPDRDGYLAVQLGFGETPSKRLSGGQLGHLKRHELPALRFLREFRVRESGGIKEGDRVTVEVFAPGDHVDVVSTGKGRGTQGGVRRHGFRGGPKTHGQSDKARAAGSIGAGTSPGRVIKGLKMAGHMGTNQVTVKNLKVVRSNPAQGILMVEGAVPGNEGVLVKVRLARRGRTE